MKSFTFRSLFNSAVIVVFTALFVLGQGSSRPSFNRTSNFDAQHYIVRVSFDRAKKKVFGDTTVQFKPLAADTRSVELDAVGLTFESVKLEPSGTALKYSTTPKSVKITLDKGYGPGDVVSIRLKYTATPQKGIYFVDASTADGEQQHSAQIWSQGEAEEARHWIPSFDFPSDKATSEEYITAETGLTVIGNGEMLGSADNHDGTTTWHYKMPVPHSTYLISLVIGKYSRVDDKYGDIPLGFYVYPGRETTARAAFGGTKRMIGVYEKLTGVKFPYNKYDQTIVSTFQFGGMENITATTMLDTEILMADFDFGKDLTTDLVSHELAHSWFGDLVTCRNWAELWLNEGFATYMEAAYREEIDGHDGYMKKIRNNAREFLVDDASTVRRHGLYNRLAGDADHLFDTAAVTYNKGGAVLYMLREVVGKEAFWKAINIYLNKHKLANVESTDLRAAMEQVSGKDLNWFFDEWVYHSGAPKLSVRQTYNPRTKTLKLTVTQTQKEDAIVPAAFRMPLTVSIKTANGEEKKDIDISKRLETFSIKVTGKPSEVVLDQEDKIILKTVKMLPMIVL